MYISKSVNVQVCYCIIFVLCVRDLPDKISSANCN